MQRLLSSKLREHLLSKETPIPVMDAAIPVLWVRRPHYANELAELPSQLTALFQQADGNFAPYQPPTPASVGVPPEPRLRVARRPRAAEASPERAFASGERALLLTNFLDMAARGLQVELPHGIPVSQVKTQAPLAARRL